MYDFWFLPYDFFKKCTGSFNFILFKHLLLYIWPLIYLFVLGRDRFFTVCICFKETCFSYNQYFSLPQTLFFNFSFRLFNKYFSLPSYQFRVSVISYFVASTGKKIEKWKEIAQIEEMKILILWETWWISMKFLGKM